MNRPNIRPHATAPHLAILTLLMASMLLSCGRQIPTAPGRGAASLRAARDAVVPAVDFENEYTDEVVIQIAPYVDPIGLADDYGAEFVEDEDGYVTVRPAAGETCDQLVLRMTGDPRVITTERNARLDTAEGRQEAVASDDAFGTIGDFLEQDAAVSIRIAEAHRVSKGGGITIAILDTGVDPHHPMLRGRLLPGWDFIDDDADPTDVATRRNTDHDGLMDEAYGHGTHVAGIAVLTAPDARILPVRVLDSDGRGDVRSVSAGIRFAIAQGARVLNLSLGMLHNSAAIHDLLEDVEDQGVMVVCSAGNWGSEEPEEYPAANSHAVAVGAVDVLAAPAAFTSYGDHLAVCAPGVGIRSAYPGGRWAVWSGTSMSAPFVSGTAALLLAIHPQWGEEEVMGRIGSTARWFTGVGPDQDGKLGDGMLDVGAALAPDIPLVMGPNPPQVPSDQPVPAIRR